jgi:nucleoside-diphosphate-sugar epimerase
MDNAKTALVLGATGGIGGEVALLLLRRGWRVRALHRNAAAVSAQGRGAGLAWVQGDAMRRDDVVAAAQDASLIVHAVNPPGYRDWDKLVLPMIDNSIAAAKASGARILLPGTVYNYGPDAFPILTEDLPQAPVTRKGRIRVEMERRMRIAAAEHGVRGLVVRAGDFFGHKASNSWFSQGMIRPGHRIGSVFRPTSRGIGHAWAYLPDLSETMVRLIEREDRLATFDSFHFAGHRDGDGTEFAASIRRVTGNAGIKLWPFPWFALYAAAPFVTMFREMIEMRYLWRERIWLDNAKLVRFLGAEPHTPLDEAMRTTLAGLGCLDGVAADRVAGSAVAA